MCIPLFGLDQLKNYSKETDLNCMCGKTKLR